jgi:hypothetical protein
VPPVVEPVDDGPMPLPRGLAYVPHPSFPKFVGRV